MMVDLEQWVVEKECSLCKMYSNNLRLVAVGCLYLTRRIRQNQTSTGFEMNIEILRKELYIEFVSFESIFELKVTTG